MEGHLSLFMDPGICKIVPRKKERREVMVLSERASDVSVCVGAGRNGMVCKRRVSSCNNNQ